MKNLTVKSATGYIQSHGYQPRHNMSSLVKACRQTAKSEKIKPVDMFKLLCFNEPLSGTHSYGFHTAYGRHLIESTESRYYQIDRELEEDQVLILN